MSNAVLYWVVVVVGLVWSTVDAQYSVEEVQQECRRLFSEDFAKFGRFVEACFEKLNLSKADINLIPNFPLYTFSNEAKLRQQEIQFCFLEAFPVAKDKKVNTELLTGFINNRLRSPVNLLQAAIKTGLESRMKTCPVDEKFWSCFWSACHLGFEDAFKNRSP